MHTPWPLDLKPYWVGEVNQADNKYQQQTPTSTSDQIQVPRYIDYIHEGHTAH